ncbi:MAG: hypothetical protein AAF640_10305 [Pseudomonadota bacterium]
MASNPDIGSCLSRGWALYRERPLLLTGAALLAGIINAAASFIPFATLVTYPLLLAGLYHMVMRLERGEAAELSHLFDGLPRFLPLVIASVLMSVLITIGVFLFVLPGLYLVIAYGFTTLNIIDRGLDFWPAMEHSRKTITAHFWTYTGFAIVVVLILFAASIPFGLGLPIAIPVCLAAQYYFYLDLDDDEVTID